jgi:hypothetical protein
MAGLLLLKSLTACLYSKPKRYLTNSLRLKLKSQQLAPLAFLLKILDVPLNKASMVAYKP